MSSDVEEVNLEFPTVFFVLHFCFFILFNGNEGLDNCAFVNVIFS